MSNILLRSYKIYACSNCDSRFQTKIALTKHTLETHTNVACPHCSRIYSSMKKSYHTHVNSTCPMLKLFKCDVCTLTFRTTQEMQHHLRLAHIKFECPKCDGKFDSASLLTIHKRRVHKKKYICSKCSGQFNKVQRYNNHLEFCNDNKSKLVSCKYCGNSVINIERHINTAHKILKIADAKNKVKCRCRKRFTFMSTYKKHLKDTHLKKCPECQSNVLDWKMTEHLRIIHKISPISKTTIFILKALERLHQQKIDENFKTITDLVMSKNPEGYIDDSSDNLAPKTSPKKDIIIINTDHDYCIKHTNIIKKKTITKSNVINEKDNKYILSHNKNHVLDTKEKSVNNNIAFESNEKNIDKSKSFNMSEFLSFKSVDNSEEPLNNNCLSIDSDVCISDVKSDGASQKPDSTETINLSEENKENISVHNGVTELNSNVQVCIDSNVVYDKNDSKNRDIFDIDEFKIVTSPECNEIDKTTYIPPSECAFNGNLTKEINLEKNNLNDDNCQTFETFRDLSVDIDVDESTNMRNKSFSLLTPKIYDKLTSETQSTDSTNKTCLDDFKKDITTSSMLDMMDISDEINIDDLIDKEFDTKLNETAAEMVDLDVSLDILSSAIVSVTPQTTIAETFTNNCANEGIFKESVAKIYEYQNNEVVPPDKIISNIVNIVDPKNLNASDITNNADKENEGLSLSKLLEDNDVIPPVMCDYNDDENCFLMPELQCIPNIDNEIEIWNEITISDTYDNVTGDVITIPQHDLGDNTDSIDVNDFFATLNSEVTDLASPTLTLCNESFGHTDTTNDGLDQIDVRDLFNGNNNSESTATHEEASKNMTHQKRSHVSNGWLCSFCNKVYKTRYKYRDHLKVSHPQAFKEEGFELEELEKLPVSKFLSLFN